MAVFVAIFFHGFGKDFLTAANGGGLPSELGTSAAYFFLSSAFVNNTAFAVFMVLWVTRLGVVPSLLVALVVWLLVAGGLYALVANFYRREPHAP